MKYWRLISRIAWNIRMAYGGWKMDEVVLSGKTLLGWCYRAGAAHCGQHALMANCVDWEAVAEPAARPRQHSYDDCGTDECLACRDINNPPTEPVAGETKRYCGKCGVAELGWRYDRCPNCGEMSITGKTMTLKSDLDRHIKPISERVRFRRTTEEALMEGLREAHCKGLARAYGICRDAGMTLDNPILKQIYDESQAPTTTTLGEYTEEKAKKFWRDKYEAAVAPAVAAPAEGKLVNLTAKKFAELEGWKFGKSNQATAFKFAESYADRCLEIVVAASTPPPADPAEEEFPTGLRLDSPPADPAKVAEQLYEILFSGHLPKEIALRYIQDALDFAVATASWKNQEALNGRS